MYCFKPQFYIINQLCRIIYIHANTGEVYNVSKTLNLNLNKYI